MTMASTPTIAPLIQPYRVRIVFPDGTGFTDWYQATSQEEAAEAAEHEWRLDDVREVVVEPQEHQVRDNAGVFTMSETDILDDDQARGGLV